MSTTTDRLPAPAATRLRRPTWRDPRLLVGIVIVAASVALGSWAVSSADTTVDVYVADGVLTPGEPVTGAQVRTVKVQLGDEAGKYLLADEPLPSDAVALRVVADGELVPRSAFGDLADLDARAVAIPVGNALSDRISAGSQVDVWFVPAVSREQEVGDPRPLTGGVTVVQVAEGGGNLVVGGTSTIHVLVPTEELPDVLGALAADGTIAVVPVGGGAA
ncbi:hypothetical protein [Oerskovia flava]|uniref:hypothetical protein n=1 Tax=Oerskovia flava TaxID=2986422 RepID=UPI00223F0F88|nr:hypothetical protein [Oerskovia sp. JB1-3-2]